MKYYHIRSTLITWSSTKESSRWGRTPRRHGGRTLRRHPPPPPGRASGGCRRGEGPGSGLLYSARPSLAHPPISSPPPPTSSRPQTSSRPSPPPATGAGSGLLLAGSEVPSPDPIRWVRVVAAAACPGVTCLARPSAGDFRCGDLPHLSVLVALLGPVPPRAPAGLLRSPSSRTKQSPKHSPWRRELRRPLWPCRSGERHDRAFLLSPKNHDGSTEML
jgi:hypothetical protein